MIGGRGWKRSSASLQIHKYTHRSISGILTSNNLLARNYLNPWLNFTLLTRFCVNFNGIITWTALHWVSAAHAIREQWSIYKTRIKDVHWRDTELPSRYSLIQPSRPLYIQSDASHAYTPTSIPAENNSSLFIRTSVLGEWVLRSGDVHLFPLMKSTQIIYIKSLQQLK